jgi:8-oxo-dGTP diphosphatase
MRASVVIVLQEDRVLLVRRCDVPVWVLPGGGIDPGETPEDAAVREVKEESGLTVRLNRKVAEYTPWRPWTQPTHLFEASRTKGELTESEESDAVAFWPLDALPSNLFSVHRFWIKDALRNQATVIKRPLTEVTIWRLLALFVRYPWSTTRYFILRVIGR